MDTQDMIIDHAFRPMFRTDQACGFTALDDTRCALQPTMHRYALQPTIEIEVWTEPTAQGTVRVDHRRVVHDVLDELNVKLSAEGLEPDESGFSNMTKYDDPAYKASGYREFSTPWPEYWRITVFPVTGGSEGHYIHVGVIGKDDNGQNRQYTTLGLAKTFRGWDHACRISAAAARLLQA